MLEDGDDGVDDIKEARLVFIDNSSEWFVAQLAIDQGGCNGIGIGCELLLEASKEGAIAGNGLDGA